MKWVVLLLFGGIGLGALISGAWWGYSRLQLSRVGVQVEGKVVDQEISTGKDNKGNITTSYTPVVEFVATNSQKVRFTGSTGGSGRPVIETGTTVNVVYDPQRPSNAQIADFSQFWLGPASIVSIGLITLLMAVGAFLVVGGSDTIPVEAMNMQRQVSLTVRADKIIVNGVVLRTEPAQGKNGKFVFVCKGERPNGFPEEFVSEAFEDNFSSSQDIKNRLIGHSVEIYIAPDDKDNYYVNIMQEIAKLVQPG